MVEAIEAARAELRRKGVPRMFPAGGVRVLRSPSLVVGK
jgi:hypothetical protein